MPTLPRRTTSLASVPTVHTLQTPHHPAPDLTIRNYSNLYPRPHNLPPTIYDDLITSHATDKEHETLLSNDMLRWKYASLERKLEEQNNLIERLQKTFWRHHLVSQVAGYDVRDS